MWIKKISSVPIGDFAKVIDSFTSGDDKQTNAPSIKATDERIDSKISPLATRLTAVEQYAGLVGRSIPTKVSQLTNDSHYATTSQIPTKVSQLTNDKSYAKTSEIPTKVSQLTNDSGYFKKSNMVVSGGNLYITL